ncbi:MAG: hypothetical protein A2W25_06350 [candidate division Zixibacteria bacterium RBG_16_53_22]|nr:MAG: hypothetical protein A2W25_06350 [candidate division Zixibacteria bacterium RBG_16_53_22]
MRITKKADYALHALFFVASLEDRGLASINEIARAEGIPREYLAKVLKALVRQGFLKSVRGVAGGYQLARPRKDITFLQVIEAIDGPLEPANCTIPEAKRSGHRKGRCPAFKQFDRIKRGLVRDLGAVNFGNIPYEKFYPGRNGRKAKVLKA